MILELTTDTLELVSGTAADLDVTACWVDAASGTLAPSGAGMQSTAVTTATTATILAAPASGQRRTLSYLCVRNKDAADTTLVTIQTDRNATNVEQYKISMAPGDTLEFMDGLGWFHLRPSTQVASGADMEAGASLVTYVTPGRQHLHPSAVKCWGKAAGAGTSLTVSYNVTSITDTGTGRLGVTIATDFSSAHYSINAQVERGVTTLGVADVEQCAIRNVSPAVGTFEIESYDHTATTLAADDPASYFWSCEGDL
jgi:hypothetical protein